MGRDEYRYDVWGQDRSVSPEEDQYYGELSEGRAKPPAARPSLSSPKASVGGVAPPLTVDLPGAPPAEDSCGFCHGGPVTDAASWVDGRHRALVPCPRCGETYE